MYVVRLLEEAEPPIVSADELPSDAAVVEDCAELVETDAVLAMEILGVLDAAEPRLAMSTTLSTEASEAPASVSRLLIKLQLPLLNVNAIHPVVAEHCSPQTVIFVALLCAIVLAAGKAV